MELGEKNSQSIQQTFNEIFNNLMKTMDTNKNSNNGNPSFLNENLETLQKTIEEK